MPRGASGQVAETICFISTFHTSGVFAAPSEVQNTMILIRFGSHVEQLGSARCRTPGLQLSFTFPMYFMIFEVPVAPSGSQKGQVFYWF